MSSLCYCCCRLTEIRSCTQGSILIQCHCGKCLTLLKEKLNHKTEHSYYSALKWSKIRMTHLLQIILTLLWRMPTVFFHSFYKINCFLFIYLFQNRNITLHGNSADKFYCFGSIFPLREQTLEQTVVIFAITFIWNCLFLCTLKSNFGQQRLAATVAAPEFK